MGDLVLDDEEACPVRCYKVEQGMAALVGCLDSHECLAELLVDGRLKSEDIAEVRPQDSLVSKDTFEVVVLMVSQQANNHTNAGRVGQSLHRCEPSE